MSKLLDKKAIVLCASSGIGLGIATELSLDGALVGITGRNLEKLKAAKNRAPFITDRTDHSVPLETGRAVTKLISELGGLDILVIHSPPPPKGSFELMKLLHWNEGVQNITLSAVEAIQAALPSLKRSLSPRIIFVLSTAAKEPISGLLISSTLRAGMLGMMKSLSREFAPDRITVNALLPGYTQTGDAVIQSSATIESLIPLHRLANPSEHGKLVAYLASEDAAYLTGQAIALDGGLIRA